MPGEVLVMLPEWVVRWCSARRTGRPRAGAAASPADHEHSPGGHPAMARTYVDLLSDPGEGGFLRALLTDPDDHATRQAYADWLEERGDPRGELLRIHSVLARGVAGEAYVTIEARFRALRSAADPLWVRLALTQSQGLNCGAAAAQAPHFR